MIVETPEDIRKLLAPKEYLVKDIWVVLNYQAILEPCGDLPNFGNFSKKNHTQHQFIFDCVPKSDHFPFGVKITYRAYSANEAVELYPVESNPNAPNVLMSARNCLVESFPSDGAKGRSTIIA